MALRFHQRPAREELEIDEQTGLPAYLQEPKRREDWDKPTAWLLGTQLLAVLKNLILSSVHRDYDVRDWMTANPMSLANEDDKDEFWFDYLADTGDSPYRVYRLARVIQQPVLAVGDESLPRGRFMLVGGDTGYPTADRMTLVERVVAPLYWARQELRDREGVEYAPGDAIRLLAIPGNHDWYDMLDGYGRQFRPSTALAYRKIDPPARRMPLDLAGYHRQQEASYFSLALPYGWHLFGIDAEFGIDARQVEYFREQLRAHDPKRLIVATSRPLVVRGAEVPKHDTIRVACKEIGFPHGELRLDLSGDTHVYERYYGPPRRDGAPTNDTFASVVCGLGGAFAHPSQVVHGDIQPQHVHPDPEVSRERFGKALLSPTRVFAAGAAGMIGVAIAIAMFRIEAHSHNTFASIPQHLAGRSFAPAMRLLRTPEQLRTPQQGDAFVSLGHVGLVVALIVVGGLAIFGALSLTRHVVARTWREVDDWPLAPLAKLCRAVRLIGLRPRVVYVAIVSGLPWLVAIALVPIALYRFVDWNDLESHRTESTVLATVMILGSAFLGSLGGWSPRTRVVSTIAGLGHGLAQLFAPFAWVCAFDQSPYVALACIAAIGVGGWSVGRFALARRSRALITLTGIAVFALTIGLPLVLVDAPDPQPTVVNTIVAGILGGYLLCQLVGWYFFVALQWQAHSNEAASVARVDDFGVFLRVRLTSDAATVWALAPGLDDDMVSVVDRFEIRSPAHARHDR